MKAKILLLLAAALIASLCLTVVGVVGVDSRLADAAMRGDRDAVRALLKAKVDVNSPQGDGMTALHWASLNGDVESAEMLIAAGANAKAITRNGSIVPLWLAAENGNPRMITLLLKAGADPNSKTTLGVTTLMTAAAGGYVDAIEALAAGGADINAQENNYGQTPLMFAAAGNHPEAIRTLLKLRANIRASTKTRGGQASRGGAAPAPQNNPAQQAQEDAPRVANEPMGGLTPLLYAVRQGHFEATHVLLENGAGINELSADKTTPLMMAVINGHFDLAMDLLQRGADPKIATVAGGTPLYRAIDVQWAPKSFYPQPSVKQEKASYLDLMKALLARGANPNVRLAKQLWYTGYGFELEGVEPAGATPFWRASEVGDLDAMKLLVSAGADPNIPTLEGVSPLLVAAGDGFHGNDAVTVPAGRMPAVRYLVEECHADVNAVDDKGGQSTSILHTNTRVYTPLHGAAARGDNEMVRYLVSKGARVNLVGKNGVTVADIANGPRERIQPFPETVKLLESLGARNNHRCVSC